MNGINSPRGLLKPAGEAIMRGPAFAIGDGVAPSGEPQKTSPAMSRAQAVGTHHQWN
jgi:hypothetical protein